MPTRAAYGARAPSCPADVDAAFVSLPVLSLPPKGCDAATERAFAISLREVCHQVGFFYITDIDHVLKETTRAGALGAARRFFSMDDATKNKMNMKSSPAFRGYVSLGAENTAGEIPMRVIPLELARNVHPSQASELLADRGRVTSRHRAPATGRVGELNCLDRRNPQRVHEFGAHGGAVRDFGGRNANAETFSGDGERRTVAVEHAAAGRDHHLVTAVL